LQMGLVMACLARRHPDQPHCDPVFTGLYSEESPVTRDDLQEIYPVASARAKEDAEFAEAARRATVELQRKRPGYLALWQHMRAVSMEDQRANFSDLGVDFDIWHGESDVADMLEPLVERLRESGVAEESEGALIVRVDEPGDKKEIPPLILVNRAGGYLY